MTGAGRPGRRRSGGTGRRAGLKIPCPQGREGSSPPPAPGESKGSKSLTLFRSSLVLMEGLERARGAPLPDELHSWGTPTADNTFHDRHEGHRASSEPRRKGRPTPDEILSLGYPATNTPRGRAMDGRRRPPPPQLTHRMRKGLSLLFPRVASNERTALEGHKVFPGSLPTRYRDRPRNIRESACPASRRSPATGFRDAGP